MSGRNEPITAWLVTEVNESISDTLKNGSLLKDRYRLSMYVLRRKT